MITKVATETHYSSLPTGTKISVDFPNEVVQFDIPGVSGIIKIPFNELMNGETGETIYDVAITIVQELHPELFKEKNV